MSLFEHTRRTLHPHTPVNVNDVHRASFSGINDRIALALTNGVGTMICAYCFALLAILGFPGLGATASQYVQWVSQTFIQLVMLSVIMVGQKVLGKHQELQADEQFQTTQKSYHDIEQIMLHLEAQSVELAKHTNMLEALQKRKELSS